jgi:hypothetical protein
LLSPPPLRTRRASFPAARSSLSNALIGTRLAAFTILAWSRRTFRVGGCTNGISVIICFSPLVGLPDSLVRKDQKEVCPLSRGVMSPKGSTPIRSITERHSLFPSSSARTAIDLPYGLSSQRERYGFTVFRLSARVGEVLSIRRRSFVHDREV